jgi:thiamine-phosphate diphosphorylase
MNPVDVRLCVIINPERTRGRDPVELVRRAVAGGCTLIRYQDARSQARRRVEQARALRVALEGTGVPLLVDDRVDVALAAGADGVHLDQADMHPNDARRLLGSNAIIGLTITSVQQADETVRLPIDYACIGGVFASLATDSSSPAVGLDGLARIAFRAKLASGAPVAAAAGINHGNAGAAIAAGADGVAVMTAVFLAEDPRSEAWRVRVAVDRALASREAPP